MLFQLPEVESKNYGLWHNTCECLPRLQTLNCVNLTTVTWFSTFQKCFQAGGSPKFRPHF